MNIFERMKKISGLKKEYDAVHKKNFELRNTEIAIADDLIEKISHYIKSYTNDLSKIDNILSIDTKISEEKNLFEQKSELLNTLKKNENYNLFVELTRKVEQLEHKKSTATKTVTEYETDYSHYYNPITVEGIPMGTMNSTSTTRPVIKTVPDEEQIRLIQSKIDSLNMTICRIPSVNKYNKNLNLDYEVRQLKNHIENLNEKKNDYDEYKDVLDDLNLNLKYYAFDEKQIKHGHADLKDILEKRAENYKKYLEIRNQLENFKQTRFLKNFHKDYKYLHRITKNRHLKPNTYLKFDVSHYDIKEAIYSDLLIIEQINYVYLENSKNALRQICHQLSKKNSKTQNAVKEDDKEFTE